MTRQAKFLRKVLQGASDQNVAFDELRELLRQLSFQERQHGSHHIFTRSVVPEILNLQPRAGESAKPYQVKQVRQIIQRHGLVHEVEDDDHDQA